MCRVQIAFLLCTLLACGSSEPQTAPLDTVEADIESTDVAVSVDEGVMADVPESVDDVASPPDLPEAAPFNFTATRPWFQCPDAPLDANTIEVVAFDKVIQQFSGENTRQVESEVEFPEGNWGQVGLWVELECPPSGLCDHWDRSGSFQMLLDSSETAGLNKYVELARHITPYKIGMCEYIDISRLAPLLKGKRTITSFIDTWVGPGHSDGEGWQVSLKFVFYPGESELPDEVINIWGRRSITVGIPEGENSIQAQTAPVEFQLPETFSKVIAHLTTTGHSFGNTYNCAEFCEMRQDVLINESVFSVNPWRGDCDKNPVSPQFGTWEYGRNGWCPGAVAIGNHIDVTSGVKAGTNVLDFDILLAGGTVYNNLQPVDLLPHELVALKLYVYH